MYTVKREDGIGKARTLHRNILLPIGSTCLELDQNETPRKPKSAPRTKTKHRKIYQKQRLVLVLIIRCQMRRWTTWFQEQTLWMAYKMKPQRMRQTVSTVDDNKQETEKTGAADAADGEKPANVSDSADDSPEDKSPSLRPQRRRQPPYLLRSGEYIAKSAAIPLKEQNQVPDWQQKALCLTELCKAGAFENINQQSLSVLMDIVSGKKVFKMTRMSFIWRGSMLYMCFNQLFANKSLFHYF